MTKQPDLSMLEFPMVRCADIVDYLNDCFGPDALTTRHVFKITHELINAAGVPSNEIDLCLEWAFGPKPPRIAFWADFQGRWKNLHPKAFQINDNDKFMEVFYVIGFTYMALKKSAQEKLRTRRM